jgi:hypothetical protein
MFKRWPTSRPGGWLTIAVVVGLAAGGGWAFAAITGSSGVIHACAAKRGGALRLAVKCKHNERAISWNMQGIPGNNGTNGTNGAPGIAFVTSMVPTTEQITSTMPGDLATPGPSVTVNVPASGLVEVYAEASFGGSGDGFVSLAEDGSVIADQPFCTDPINPSVQVRGILQGGGPAFVPIHSIPGICAGASEPGASSAGGLLIFHTTPGTHTYKLVYSTDTGVYVKTRQLSVAPGS